uniref:Keratin-associated protein n=1 Tax=Equus caballus TaxID=9796 RepID=A0A3Q2GZG2_HORSE
IHSSGSSSCWTQRLVTWHKLTGRDCRLGRSLDGSRTSGRGWTPHRTSGIWGASSRSPHSHCRKKSPAGRCWESRDQCCRPGSSCGSSYPSNLVYSTDLCSPSTCQLGSSLCGGCQKTYWEPTRYQTSCVVSSPCQRSCYRPRISTVCSPCRSTYARSLGFGSSSCCSLGYGSRISYSRGCGSRGFRPLSCGVCGFPSLGYRSRFCHPTFLASRSCQTSCFRPTCRSGFYY